MNKNTKNYLQVTFHQQSTFQKNSAIVKEMTKVKLHSDNLKEIRLVIWEPLVRKQATMKLFLQTVTVTRVKAAMLMQHLKTLTVKQEKNILNKISLNKEETMIVLIIKRDGLNIRLFLFPAILLIIQEHLLYHQGYLRDFRRSCNRIQPYLLYQQLCCDLLLLQEFYPIFPLI